MKQTIPNFESINNNNFFTRSLLYSCIIIIIMISIILFLTIISFVGNSLSSDVNFRSFNHPKVYKCGQEGSDLVVNFVNKNYPENDTGGKECKFRMLVTNPSICQIRVDFVDTELMKPNRGDCLSQQFEVEGAVWSTGLPPLCGKQDDQHFYLHLEQWTSNITFVDFKVTTISNNEQYKFGVWLTQIDCSSFNVLKAPEGCTQYFLGEKGILKSFNFEGTRYLNGEHYRICIRPGKQVCGISYEATLGDFALKKSIKTTKDVIMRSGTGPHICGMDYLLIPGGQPVSSFHKRSARMFFSRPAAAARPPPRRRKKAKAKSRPQRRSTKMKPSQDRFCGGKLSPKTGENKNKPIFAPVRSNLITLLVKTSGLVEAQNLRQQVFGKAVNTTVGFRISYQQTRNCENHETDLVSPQSIKNLLLSTEQYQQGIPYIRDGLDETEDDTEKSILAASEANVTIVKGFDQKTFDISDEDKIWEYLDNANSEKSLDEELYDFL